MSQMAPCPKCGAVNSELRVLCYACGARLHEAPPAPYATCKDCRHSTIFPPPPHRIAHDEIWCTLYDKPMAAEGQAPPCFEPAFGWARTETMD